LDDAVLSCGNLLAGRPGSRIVTVFTSGGPVPGWVPGWESLSGLWQPGDDVSAARRAEDELVMTLLAAEPAHLGFTDLQYRIGPPPRSLALRPWYRLAAYRRAHSRELGRRVEARLQAEIALSKLQTWLVPLGLRHTDHKLVARACRRVASALPDRRWVIYEELPYAREPSAQGAAALAGLSHAGWAISPLEPAGPTDDGAKRQLVACYKSQLKALGDGVDIALAGPEKYYSLSAQGKPLPLMLLL
jgi:LmbE family N-acetylglucosaminyl deacetylase